ncbi:hypothetical protein ACN38_g12938 [Penicillium nordicum]|uniref:Uncharacterized protein n=1 Tax=Penicillium nordicum TaxID=229535 RepID=A0A0M8NXS3_9EURO|nr:hypothetical protein ACN38_g12938 [Penicillium nordicum]
MATLDAGLSSLFTKILVIITSRVHNVLLITEHSGLLSDLLTLHSVCSGLLSDLLTLRSVCSGQLISDDVMLSILQSVCSRSRQR